MSCKCNCDDEVRRAWRRGASQNGRRWHAAWQLASPAAKLAVADDVAFPSSAKTSAEPWRVARAERPATAALAVGAHDACLLRQSVHAFALGIT